MHDPAPDEPEPPGLVQELDTARARLRLRFTHSDEDPRVGWEARRTAAVRAGWWEEPEVVRRSLRPNLERLAQAPGEPHALPSSRDGFEFLPLTFDGRAGPIAFASSGATWSLLELSAEGDRVKRIGTIVPRILPMTEGAGQLLARYLAYWLERDDLWGMLAESISEDPVPISMNRAAERELRSISADVRLRASALRASRKLPEGPLGADEIAAGIRAADLDLLDRDGWGERL